MTDNKPKKVVFILPSLQPGGAERVLITLMNNLPRTGYDTRFISFSGEGAAKHWINPDIPTYSLNKQRISLGMIALYKKLREIKPDVVCSTIIHTNAALLLLKPFFPGVRFIIRESSLPMALIKKHGFEGHIIRCMYKYLYPRADAVISPAKIIVHEFKNKLGINVDNHVVLYNPVNEEILQSALKQEGQEGHYAKQTETVKFICVGRLVYEKGYDRLIQALQNLQMAGNSDWHLTIIGGGAETANLSKLIESHNLQGRIHLAGHNDMPWPHVAAADCLLLPSRWEGMPNAVLEALACGIKVIGHNDAGGIVEISALAKEGDVQIARDMKEFVDLMKNIKSAQKQSRLQSKLPAEFKLKQVMSDFRALLYYQKH